MTRALLLTELRETAASVVVAVLPLVVLFVVFQVLVLRLPRRDFRNILVGTALSAAGLLLFLLGVSLGFLPIGRAIGEALGSLSSTWRGSRSQARGAGRVEASGLPASSPRRGRCRRPPSPSRRPR